jgi:hypothetical protein
MSWYIVVVTWNKKLYNFLFRQYLPQQANVEIECILILSFSDLLMHLIPTVIFFSNVNHYYLTLFSLRETCNVLNDQEKVLANSLQQLKQDGCKKKLVISSFDSYSQHSIQHVHSASLFSVIF